RQRVPAPRRPAGRGRVERPGGNVPVARMAVQRYERQAGDESGGGRRNVSGGAARRRRIRGRGVEAGKAKREGHIAFILSRLASRDRNGRLFPKRRDRPYSVTSGREKSCS